jgi:hypothetical protein
MWSEERSQGEEAMKSAGFVAVNRVGISSFPSTLAEVLEQTNAFSLNNAFDGPLSGSDASTKTLALSLAEKILNNQISDNTKGAMFFVNSEDADLMNTAFSSCSLSISGFDYNRISSSTMYVYSDYCKAVSDAV